MNTFNIIGRLTKDPEVSTTDKGSTICKFTLAVKRPYSKTETDFFPFTAWRGQAEFISRYFKKGDRLAVTGYVTSRTYTVKEEKRTGFDWVVENAEFCESSDKTTTVSTTEMDTGTFVVENSAPTDTSYPPETEPQDISHGANIMKKQEIYTDDLPF